MIWLCLLLTTTSVALGSLVAALRRERHWRDSKPSSLTSAGLLEFLRRARLQGVRHIELDNLEVDLEAPTQAEVNAELPAEVVQKTEAEKVKEQLAAEMRAELWSAPDPRDTTGL